MVLPRDFISRCAAAYVDKTALVDGEVRRSWRELHERSNRLASALQALGVKKGDAVAMLAFDHIEMIEHWFACMKIGAIRVGINWRYAPREMLHLVSDSGAKVVFVQTDCLPLLKERLEEFKQGRTMVGLRGAHGLTLDYEQLIASHDREPELPPLAEDDVIGISYTSGTTGLPKGAIWTQKAVRECLVHTNLQIGFRYEDVFLSPGSTAGVGIVLNSFGLVNGMTTILPANGKFSATGWLEQLQRERGTTTLLMPTLMQRILEEQRAANVDISSLRLLTYGSEPTRPRIIREWHETFTGCEIMQIYGLTECVGGWLTFLRHEDHLRAFAGETHLITSCGRPGVHIDMSIRDPEGKELPIGEVGEFWVRGDVNIVGYLNRPEETREALRGEWLRTHDLGKRDEEGFYYLTDRAKFLIITGAFNVFPVVVENVLSEHPAVREVAVVGAPHPEWGEAVVACVSLRPGTSATPEELIAHCRGKVGQWEMPKFVDIIPDLPKGGTHKIAKHTIREWYRKDPSRLPWGDRLAEGSDPRS